MTTNSLLRVMATALFLVAACKSEFPAGSYEDGGAQDASAQEAAVLQDSGTGIGPTKPAGLNLAGLTAVTVTTSGGSPGIQGDACSTDNKDVFTLVFQTRVLSWEHCAIDSSTGNPYRKTDTQLLTDYEVTAARLLLDLLSTDYSRTSCGADKALETLDLTFADRVEKYQDDFYAGCPNYAPVDGRTYLHYVDLIASWLDELGRGSNPLPSSFLSLAVVSDLDPFPSSAAMTAATAACGNAVNPSYNVTVATQTINWSSCVSGSTGYKLQTGNRVLSEGDFARVMQSWSAIQLGATGHCSTPRSLKSLQLTTAPGVYSYLYLNDFAACSRDTASAYSMYVVGLDDLAALLASLADGSSPSDAGVSDSGPSNPDGGNDAAAALKGVFVPTGSMIVARMSHTATLLPGGQVLIAGGVGNFALVSAELYDSVAGIFTVTGNMTVARADHTATLLSGGKVLIVGGSNGTNYLTSADIYDPATRTFTVTGSMTVARTEQTATLLRSGKVLIAGGAGSSAELYDPATGTFTATGSMTTTRTKQTATLLPSGKVLIAGGYDHTSLASAELYDPTAGTFTATGSMTVSSYYHTATLLPSGKVLIAGGYDLGYLASTELYDPVTGTFTAAGSMTAGRASHTATLLGTGKVLIASGDPSWASAELYDPGAGTSAATGDMTVPRAYSTATLLGSGEVLVAGGLSSRELGVPLASAELYQ